MPIGGGGHDTYELTKTDIDANTNYTTESLDITDGTYVGLYVSSKSGSSSTHVVTLQISPDGVKWFDTDHTIKGTGNVHDVICIAQYVRAKVTTREGSASTIDIDIISK